VPLLAEPGGAQLKTHWFRDLLLGLSPLLLGIQILLLTAFLSAASRGQADFGAFYIGGYMLRAGLGHQLYDYGVEKHFQTAFVSTTPAPYIHLPYEALLFVPLSLFHYRAAFLTFLGLNCLLVLFSFQVIRIDSDLQLAGLLFASYLPLSATLADGQDSILMLAIAVGSWRLLRQGRDISSGAVLALGLFRFQLLIPIGVLFLIWKRWRFVLSLCVWSAVLFIVSVALVGPDQMRLYCTHLLSMSISPQELVYAQPIARMVNFRGLVASALPHSHTAAQLITAIISIALLIWTAHRARSLNSTEQFSLAVCASVLVSYHLFVYDLSILVIPMMTALGMMNEKPSTQVAFAFPILLVAVPVFLLGNLLYLMALPICAFLFALSATLTDHCCTS
jgi:glycosyl transferase family 87